MFIRLIRVMLFAFDLHATLGLHTADTQSYRGNASIAILAAMLLPALHAAKAKGPDAGFPWKSATTGLTMHLYAEFLPHPSFNQWDEPFPGEWFLIYQNYLLDVAALATAPAISRTSAKRYAGVRLPDDNGSDPL